MGLKVRRLKKEGRGLVGSPYSTLKPPVSFTPRACVLCADARYYYNPIFPPVLTSPGYRRDHLTTHTVLHALFASVPLFLHLYARILFPGELLPLLLLLSSATPPVLSVPCSAPSKTTTKSFWSRRGVDPPTDPKASNILVTHARNTYAYITREKLSHSGLVKRKWGRVCATHTCCVLYTA